MARGVYVIGSVNLDLVVRLATLPGPGETVTGGTFERHGGGKSANQAVAAARHGATVRMIGAVGDDDLGEEAVAQLEAERIDVSAVQRLATPTGVALIAVDAHGENQIAVASGARAERAAGLGVVLNPAPARPLPDDVLALSPVLTPNGPEAAALSGEDDPKAAARALTARTGAPVVVTVGADGALLADGDTLERI